MTVNGSPALNFFEQRFWGQALKQKQRTEMNFLCTLLEKEVVGTPNYNSQPLRYS